MVGCSVSLSAFLKEPDVGAKISERRTIVVLAKPGAAFLVGDTASASITRPGQGQASSFTGGNKRFYIHPLYDAV